MSEASEARTEVAEEGVTLVHHVADDFSLPHEIAFVLIITCAQLMSQAGLGQAIAPMRIIGESFGSTDMGQLTWFAAAYSLTVGTFILIMGRLGDLYGHKRMFIFGFLWYALWSLLAGISVYSHSIIFFDICRAMQGIGPSSALPNGLALLGHAYPPGPRKNMAFACFGSIAPGGYLLGAVFSSLFAQLAWWPWAFWTTAIVCVILAGLAFFIIPPMDRGVDEKAESGHSKFDYAGSITGVAGLVLINFAWNQAPSVGWNEPYVYVLLIVGLLLMVVFVLIERRVADPLIPMNLFTGGTGFVLALIALGWSSFGIWVYYAWQFMESLQNLTPLNATARFVPATPSGILAAMTTGFLISRVRTAYIMVAAMCFFCTGLILLSTTSIDQVYWAQMFVSMLVTPWGMDMSFPAATIILSDFVPKGQQGIAASLVNTVVNYSISIGLGIAGTVQVHLDNGGTDLLRGYRSAWYTGIGLSGFGILVAIVFAFWSRHETPRATA